jgi:hypothetical protein
MRQLLPAAIPRDFFPTDVSLDSVRCASRSLPIQITVTIAVVNTVSHESTIRGCNHKGLLHSSPSYSLSPCQFPYHNDPRHSVLPRQHPRFPCYVHRRHIPLYRRECQIRHSKCHHHSVGYGIWAQGCRIQSVEHPKRTPILCPPCHLSEPTLPIARCSLVIVSYNIFTNLSVHSHRNHQKKNILKS